MELGNELFFGCGELIFALTREKKNLGFFSRFCANYFLGVFFWVFFGVFVLLGGCFCAFGVLSFFSRAARFFFELIFRNGAEQNGGFPLCVTELTAQQRTWTGRDGGRGGAPSLQLHGALVLFKTKNRLVLLSSFFEFAVLGVVFNRVGWCCP